MSLPAIGGERQTVTATVTEEQARWWAEKIRALHPVEAATYGLKDGDSVEINGEKVPVHIAEQHDAHMRDAARLTTGICARSSGCLCEKDGSIKEGCSCWVVAQANPHPIQQGEARNNTFQPLIFNSQQWWMAKAPQTIKWSEISDPTDWSTRDDHIMSAVRDIARGG